MSKTNPRQPHHRRSTRLKGCDYSLPGCYFITVLKYQRELLFGEIVNGEMELNALGEIAAKTWLEIPHRFPYVELDSFVIMPNHVHGIIQIVEPDHVGAQHAAPLPPKHRPHVISGSLGAIVRSFKSAVTTRINQQRRTPKQPVWQRNHYDHIIRNDKELNDIRRYIKHNPQAWSDDQDNPQNQSPLT